jgi:hypothetical protein
MIEASIPSGSENLMKARKTFDRIEIEAEIKSVYCAKSAVPRHSAESDITGKRA